MNTVVRVIKKDSILYEHRNSYTLEEKPNIFVQPTFYKEDVENNPDVFEEIKATPDA